MYKKEIDKLIKVYLKKKELYEDFTELIASLVKSFIAGAGIMHYSIERRSKTTDSLRKKIKRKCSQGKKCAKLEDITDLAGIRIIVYFTNDVKRIQKIITTEFNSLNSKDTKHKFTYEEKAVKGYLVEKEIIKLTLSRVSLKEYGRYKNLMCEVQVRSILQHAWSEIEHGIWYKPKVKEADLKSSDIKSLFMKNSKLLTRVDENFVKIREEHIKLLSEHIVKIERKNFKELPINYDIVKAFLMNIYGKSKITNDIVLDALEVANKHGLNNLFELNKYFRKYKNDSML